MENKKTNPTSNAKKTDLVLKTLYELYIKNPCKQGVERVIETHKLNLTVQKYVACLLKYIKEQILISEDIPDYGKVYEKLLTLSKEEANEYLNRQNLPLSYLKENIDKYFIEFRPDIIILNPKIYDNLTINILNSSITQKKKTVSSSNRVSKLSDKEKEKYKQLIEECINSKYSIKRFLTFKNTSMNYLKYNGVINYMRLNLPTLYQEFLMSQEMKENAENITNDVYKIFKIAKEKKENFNCIDLYINTIYSPEELIKKANEIFDKEDRTFFSKNVVSLFSMRFFPKQQLQYDSLLNNRFGITVNGELIETTFEERKLILDFLTKNFIPLNSTTYISAFKKFFNNELPYEKCK